MVKRPNRVPLYRAKYLWLRRAQLAWIDADEQSSKKPAHLWSRRKRKGRSGKSGLDLVERLRKD